MTISVSLFAPAPSWLALKTMGASLPFWDPALLAGKESIASFSNWGAEPAAAVPMEPHKLTWLEKNLKKLFFKLVRAWWGWVRLKPEHTVCL